MVLASLAGCKVSGWSLLFFMLFFVVMLCERGDVIHVEKRRKICIWMVYIAYLVQTGFRFYFTSFLVNVLSECMFFQGRSLRDISHLRGDVGYSAESF